MATNDRARPEGVQDEPTPGFLAASGVRSSRGILCSDEGPSRPRRPPGATQEHTPRLPACAARRLPLPRAHPPARPRSLDAIGEPRAAGRASAAARFGRPRPTNRGAAVGRFVASTAGISDARAGGRTGVTVWPARRTNCTCCRPARAAAGAARIAGHPGSRLHPDRGLGVVVAPAVSLMSRGDLARGADARGRALRSRGIPMNRARPVTPILGMRRRSTGMPPREREAPRAVSCAPCARPHSRAPVRSSFRYCCWSLPARVPRHPSTVPATCLRPPSW